MIYSGGSLMMVKASNFSSMRASMSCKSRLHFGLACKRTIFVIRGASNDTFERTCGDYVCSVSDGNRSRMQDFFWLHLLLLLAGHIALISERAPLQLFFGCCG